MRLGAAFLCALSPYRLLWGGSSDLSTRGMGKNAHVEPFPLILGIVFLQSVAREIRRVKERHFSPLGISGQELLIQER